jgi:hypothetical protein
MVLGEDEVAHSRLQLCDFKHRSGPSPTLTQREKGRGTITVAVKRRLRGSNPDGSGTEIYAGRNFPGR